LDYGKVSENYLNQFDRFLECSLCASLGRESQLAFCAKVKKRASVANGVGDLEKHDDILNIIKRHVCARAAPSERAMLLLCASDP
jgi:hypothetical protein